MIQKLAIITLTVIILAGIVLLIFNPVRPTEITVAAGNGSPKSRFGIFGAVKTPGYYSSDGPIRIEEAVDMAGGMSEDADEVNAHLAKWIEDGETVIIPTQGAPLPTLTPIVKDEELIDLNSATLEELMRLPGIGEKRAAEIIRLREQKGGFTAKEDILEISGISEKLLGSIYDRLIIK